MEQIPTAKELYLKTVFPIYFENRPDEIKLWFETTPDAKQSVEIMIEFAKLHVEQALKAKIEAMEKYYEDGGYSLSEMDAFTRNSYPLTNIK